MKTKKEFITLVRNKEDGIRPNTTADTARTASYYGLRDFTGPTLKDFAKAMNIGTGEAKIQITDGRSEKYSQPQKKELLLRMIQLIEQRSIWSEQDLFSAIKDLNVISDKERETIPHLTDLLKLIADMGLKQPFPYHIYTPFMSKVTQQSQANYIQIFLVHDGVKTWLSAAMTDINRSAHNDGICDLKRVLMNHPNVKPYHSNLLEMIRACPDVWVDEETEEWYGFEAVENPIITHSVRLSFFYRPLPIGRHVKLIWNSLMHRYLDDHKLNIPPSDVIQRFIRQSRYFRVIDDNVHFDTTNTDLEKVLKELDGDKNVQIMRDLIDLLAKSDRWTTCGLSVALNKLGHKDDGLNFIFLASQLAWARSKSNHKIFTLAGDLNIGINESLSKNKAADQPKKTVNDRESRANSLVPNNHSWEENKENETRYNEANNKLSRLKSTDCYQEIKQRLEQSFLREYLFAEKTHECCAICGEYLSIHTLVAAHKTARKLLSEDARCDAYIVMPICKFGCDYLYEYGHVYISCGSVKEGVPIDSAYEQKRVQSLLDKRLDPRWLKGDPRYFSNPLKS